MKSAMTASVNFVGSMPFALHHRASRDRPRCIRLDDNSEISLCQLSPKGVFAEVKTGLIADAFTADKKADLILAKVLSVRPAAAGMHTANRRPMVGRSSGIWLSSCP